jgi:hypothetical protein
MPKGTPFRTTLTLPRASIQLELEIPISWTWFIFLVSKFPQCRPLEGE